MSIFDRGELIPVPERFQFDCRIVDKETGETIIEDFSYLTGIDEFGGCESVELHLYAMLRAFRRDLQEAAERIREDELEDA